MASAVASAACRSPSERPLRTESSPEASVLPRATHLSLRQGPPVGDVARAVREATALAASERRRLVVYVGAVWCEPCQRFHDAASRGDLDAILPEVTLLEFDLDRDAARLAAAGYGSTYIPLFALPLANGTASEKRVEGGIKGDGAVGFVVAGLVRLLGP